MGKQWKQWQTSWAPKSLQMVTAAMKLKDTFFLGRKVMTNLDSILESRDITLPTNVLLVKAMVFPVVMYRYECWTIKKAEHRRIDAFELCYWRRFLRVPWTARRSNQSILKEISPGCSLEGLMLKLKLQYWLIWKDPWCWERLKAGGEGDDRGWDGWMASPTQWTWSEWTPGVGDGQGGLASMGLQRVGHDWVTELNFSCGMWDLVPWPGTEPGLPAVGVSFCHWTTREVP